MLLLTRRVGERLKIADNITVTVLGISRGQVRLGIDAPNDVPIWREEIYQLKEKNDDDMCQLPTENPNRTGEPQGL